MGQTIHEWEELFKKNYTIEQLELFGKIEDIIKTIPEVHQEFAWTGISLISHIAKTVAKHKKLKKGKGKITFKPDPVPIMSVPVDIDTTKKITLQTLKTHFIILQDGKTIGQMLNAELDSFKNWMTEQGIEFE